MILATDHIDSLIAATPAAVSAIIGFVLLRRGTTMHKDMNSRLDQLVKAREEAAHAAGQVQGRMEGREFERSEAAGRRQQTQ